VVPTQAWFSQVANRSNEEYDPPRTTRQDHIGQDIGRDIGAVAELDPFNEKYQFGLQLDVDGEVGTYAFQPRVKPHAYAASPSKQLPAQGNLVVASHGEYKKLEHYEKYDDILKAIAAEYNGFDDRGVWELVPVPEHETLQDAMIMIKEKRAPDGTFIKIKGRCVVRGDRMVQGVHYTDTFAPTTGLCALRCLLSTAVTHGWSVKSCDATQAFCNATPEFPTYLRTPPGLRQQYKNSRPMCYKLKKQTYGVPNGPRRWHIVLHNWLMRYNEDQPVKPQWTQSSLEPCLYHLRGDECDERVDCCVFVDDLCSAFPETTTGKKCYGDFIEAFKADFDLGDDGYTDCTEFTGINLTWNEDRTELAMDQPHVVNSMLQRYNFDNSRSSYTPALANTLLSTLDSPKEGPEGEADRTYMKDKPYRQCIGDLLWITRVYRYDIQYAVNACARMANNPGPKHWAAVCKILRYLNHTKNFKLVYSKPTTTAPHVTGYADSDWAPNYGDYFDNYRSTSGSIISHNKHALTWRSRRQERVAQSSTEAEYYAAADAAKELTFISRLMKSMAYDATTIGTPVLKMDNKSAIQAAQNAQDNV